MQLTDAVCASVYPALAKENARVLGEIAASPNGLPQMVAAPLLEHGSESPYNIQPPMGSQHPGKTYGHKTEHCYGAFAAYAVENAPSLIPNAGARTHAVGTVFAFGLL